MEEIFNEEIAESLGRYFCCVVSFKYQLNFIFKV